MCETMCEGNNESACNGGTPKGNGKMCYACEAAINHLGQLQGWGDPSCIDHPHSGMITFCDDDEDTCITEFTAEWKLLGQQVHSSITTSMTVPYLLGVHNEERVW